MESGGEWLRCWRGSEREKEQDQEWEQEQEQEQDIPPPPSTLQALRTRNYRLLFQSP